MDGIQDTKTGQRINLEQFNLEQCTAADLRAHLQGLTGIADPLAINDTDKASAQKRIAKALTEQKNGDQALVVKAAELSLKTVQAYCVKRKPPNQAKESNFLRSQRLEDITRQQFMLRELIKWTAPLVGSKHANTIKEMSFKNASPEPKKLHVIFYGMFCELDRLYSTYLSKAHDMSRIIEIVESIDEKHEGSSPHHGVMSLAFAKYILLKLSSITDTSLYTTPPSKSVALINNLNKTPEQDDPELETLNHINVDIEDIQKCLQKRERPKQQTNVFDGEDESVLSFFDDETFVSSPETQPIKTNEHESSTEAMSKHDNGLHDEFNWDEFSKFCIEIVEIDAKEFESYEINPEHQGNDAFPLYRWLFWLKKETSELKWQNNTAFKIGQFFELDDKASIDNMILSHLGAKKRKPVLFDNDEDFEDETFTEDTPSPVPKNKDAQAKTGFRGLFEQSSKISLPIQPNKKNKALINHPPLVTHTVDGVDCVDCCIAMVKPSRDNAKFKDVYKMDDGTVKLQGNGEMCLYIGHPYRSLKWAEKYYDEHKWKWSPTHRIKKIALYLYELELKAKQVGSTRVSNLIDDIKCTLNNNKKTDTNLYELATRYMKSCGHGLKAPRYDIKGEIDTQVIKAGVVNANRLENFLYEKIGDGVHNLEAMLEGPQDVTTIGKPTPTLNMTLDLKNSDSVCGVSTVFKSHAALNESQGSATVLSISTGSTAEMLFNAVHGAKEFIDNTFTESYHSFANTTVCTFSIPVHTAKHLLRHCRAESEGGYQITSRDVKYGPGAYALRGRARNYLESNIIPNTLVTYARFESLMSDEEKETSGELRNLRTLSEILYAHNIDDILPTTWIQGLSSKKRFSTEHSKRPSGSLRNDIRNLQGLLINLFKKENGLNQTTLNQLIALARSYNAHYNFSDIEITQNETTEIFAAIFYIKERLSSGLTLDQIIKQSEEASLIYVIARLFKAIDCTIYQLHIQLRIFAWHDYWDARTEFETPEHQNDSQDNQDKLDSQYPTIARADHYDFERGTFNTLLKTTSHTPVDKTGKKVAAITMVTVKFGEKIYALLVQQLAAKKSDDLYEALKIPGGNVDADEGKEGNKKHPDVSIEQGAFRELEEEIGLNIYDLPPGTSLDGNITHLPTQKNTGKTVYILHVRLETQDINAFVNHLMPRCEDMSTREFIGGRIHLLPLDKITDNSGVELDQSAVVSYIIPHKNEDRVALFDKAKKKFEEPKHRTKIVKKSDLLPLLEIKPGETFEFMGFDDVQKTNRTICEDAIRRHQALNSSTASLSLHHYRWSNTTRPDPRSRGPVHGAGSASGGMTRSFG